MEEEIAEYVKDDELRGSMDKKRTVEKNRERIEIRTAYTSDDAAWLCGREKWKNLCCIGAIRKEVEADGKRTEEWHYYISSRRLSAEELLHHARMEWAVESMHWLLARRSPAFSQESPPCRRAERTCRRCACR